MSKRCKPLILLECERGDLNPYGLTRWILSPVRLPVPPLSPDLFKFNIIEIFYQHCHSFSLHIALKKIDHFQ